MVGKMRAGEGLELRNERRRGNKDPSSGDRGKRSILLNYLSVGKGF